MTTPVGGVDMNSYSLRQVIGLIGECFRLTVEAAFLAAWQAIDPVACFLGSVGERGGLTVLPLRRDVGERSWWRVGRFLARQEETGAKGGASAEQSTGVGWTGIALLTRTDRQNILLREGLSNLNRRVGPGTVRLPATGSRLGIGRQQADSGISGFAQFGFDPGAQNGLFKGGKRASSETAWNVSARIGFSPSFTHHGAQPIPLWRVLLVSRTAH